MNDMAGALTVARLVAIKREELDRYRQDLVRLEQIVEAARAEHYAASESERNFLDEMRQSEHARKSLDASGMIERRRYLTHLQSQTEQQQVALDQALAQRDQAHRCLEQAFSEMRALERLAERRLARARTERQRLEYSRSDDEEITRKMSRGGRHAER